MMLPRSHSGIGATNDQIAPSQYTGPVGGYACNAAGGYTLVTPKGYMTPQCMTPDQLAQANASYDAAPTVVGVVTSGDPIMVLAPNTAPTSIPSSPIPATIITAPPAQNAVAGSALGPANNALVNSGVPVMQTASGDLMLGSVDLSTLPTWAYVSAGLVVALLLFRK